MVKSIKKKFPKYKSIIYILLIISSLVIPPIVANDESLSSDVSLTLVHITVKEIKGDNYGLGAGVWNSQEITITPVGGGESQSQKKDSWFSSSIKPNWEFSWAAIHEKDQL